MSLTDEERAKVRHHLGYLNVSAVASFNLGVPAALQTTFMIEGAFDKILPVAENMVRQLICRLEAIETQVYEGSDLADILETATVKINPDRLKVLADYYRIAQQSLANLFGVIPNPFDLRSWVRTGGGSVNVPVQG